MEGIDNGHIRGRLLDKQILSLIFQKMNNYLPLQALRGSLLKWNMSSIQTKRNNNQIRKIIPSFSKTSIVGESIKSKSKILSPQLNYLQGYQGVLSFMKTLNSKRTNWTASIRHKNQYESAMVLISNHSLFEHFYPNSQHLTILSIGNVDEMRKSI